MSYVPSRQTARSCSSRGPSIWTENAKYFDGLKLRQRFFELEGVGAEIDELACGRPGRRRFRRSADAAAARRRESRRSAAPHSSAASKHCSGVRLPPQDFRRKLNFAAAGAGQIAAKQRLQHQHQRIALHAAQPLPQDVGGDGIGLGDGGMESIYSGFTSCRVQSSEFPTLNSSDTLTTLNAVIAQVPAAGSRCG